uniref:Uncharacterized protein n=1 Tax=Sciurus vulgaris TaxID=55149 RepID=A0A8D2DPH6_SCIVU
MEPPGGGEQPPQQPWGRLLRLGAEESEPHVLLWKREWTIGRRRETPKPPVRMSELLL